MSDKKEIIRKFNNEVATRFGKTVCLAKWKHLNLYLHLQEGHSCYHPPPHKISVEQVRENLWAIHNTPEKIVARAEMLSGIGPKECSYCWNIEKLDSKNISDRHIKTYEESWDGDMKRVENILSSGLSDKVSPSVIEVSFANTCNFKCVYCNPKASSRWADEIKRFGPYQGLDNDYKIEQIFLEEDANELLQSFRMWLPMLKGELVGLRVTGGEPLLQKTTFHILNDIVANPQPDLVLMINSNLGSSPQILEKFCDIVRTIHKNEAVRNFRLYTSLESTGARAEYVRYGLDFELWKKNAAYYLENTPYDLAVMCTYNLLSVTSYTDFLKLLLEFRKKYCTNRKRIQLDIPYLDYPRMFHASLLGPNYLNYISESIEFMKKNYSEKDPTLFDSVEISKLKRIHDLWKSGPLSEKEMTEQRKQFLRFQSEADRRRDTDFISTFPELKAFVEGNHE